MIHHLQHIDSVGAGNSARNKQDNDDNQCNSSQVFNRRQTNTSVANLDDYIYELENRTRSESKLNKSFENPELTDSAMNKSDENLLSQLQQKEKDLILAAELGKALLDRNEELSRANEKITEEYSHKLEVINIQLI